MIQLQGFDKFIEQVNKLPDTVKGNVMAGIMRKNMTPIKNAIKSNAPIRNEKFSKSTRIRYDSKGKISTQSERGNLKKSIGIRTFNTRKGISVYAGIQNGKKLEEGQGRTNDGWYGYFVERGTKHQAPQPFIAPAAASTVPAATKSLEQDTTDYIIKNAKKLGLDAK